MMMAALRCRLFPIPALKDGAMHGPYSKAPTTRRGSVVLRSMAEPAFEARLLKVFCVALGFNPGFGRSGSCQWAMCSGRCSGDIRNGGWSSQTSASSLSPIMPSPPGPRISPQGVIRLPLRPVLKLTAQSSPTDKSCQNPDHMSIWLPHSPAVLGRRQRNRSNRYYGAHSTPEPGRQPL